MIQYMYSFLVLEDMVHDSRSLQTKYTCLFKPVPMLSQGILGGGL